MLSQSNLLLPLLKTGAVHLLMFILLFTSFHNTAKSKPVDVEVNAAPVIKATAVSSADVKKIVEAKKKNIADKARAESNRKKKIRQNAAAKKKKIANDKRKKKVADDKKKKLADDKRKQKLADDKKKIADKKLKDDAEKKKKAEEAQRQKIQREKEIQAQVDADIRAAKRQQVLTERQKYIALIKDKIRRNWRPSGKCVVEIKLAPGGLVIDVREVSGDVASCRSAKAAVYQAEPLPVSKDSAVFNELRNIRIILDPQEN